ncbi:MAG: mechanosensitive ion channel family protein [Synechococcaceae cyanobacterium]|nr:mechanosensitive ion channel family protein [Synechococcaceae cyanobacterium]
MSLLQRGLIALVLLGLLLALRLFCRRRRLAPVPLALPTLALLAWLVLTGLPPDLVTAARRPWVDSALALSGSYAVLQLAGWAGFELPSFLPWWPRPAKILRDLGLLLIAAAITVVVLQQQARINVVGLVTTSAVLTAVIGLAAQETLKDLFAGIMLQVDAPFREGDFLDLGEDICGWVVSLTLMSTRLQHVHGALITLPNSRLWGGHIRRFGRRGPIAREIHLNLELTLPPEQARALLLEVAAQHPLVLPDPAPEAFVYAYGDQAITYELEVWQEDPTDNGFDLLRGQLLAQIWYGLERLGRSLPRPIRELHPRPRLPRPEGPAALGMEERLGLLQQNAIFGHLTSAQLERIAPHTRCVRFAPGEAVVVEGDEGHAMFQVVRGRVQVLKRMDDGRHHPLAELGEGAVFGEMSVFNEEPRTATVRALVECTLLEVERDDLRPLLAGNPALVERLAHLIGERRAQLSNLSREVGEAQTNQLLRTMLRMFSGFKGG